MLRNSTDDAEEFNWWDWNTIQLMKFVIHSTDESGIQLMKSRAVESNQNFQLMKQRAVESDWSLSLTNNMDRKSHGSNYTKIDMEA